MKLPHVVIVILNWNLADVTVSCVRSVLGGDYLNQRVLVVDNGSTDDSIAHLQHIFGETIEILATGENLYFAGGMNRGLQWALTTDAEYVLLLNNDTRIGTDMLSRMISMAESDPVIGLVGPMIYFEEPPNKIWALGSRRVSWLPIPQEIGRGQIDRGQYSVPLDVDYLVGCAMLIKRLVLEEIGLLDPQYRMYYEDADFCARARGAGYRLVAEPRAKMWHLVSASAKQEVALSRYHHTRYRIQFYRQHQHSILSWITHFFLLTQESLRWIAMAARGRLDLARAIWQGLRDGYRQWP